MSAERWETLARQLAEIGLLERVAVWENAFDNRFVQTGARGT
jgi:hypothetical protein